MYTYRLFRRYKNGKPLAFWWVGIGRKVAESTRTEDKAAAHEYAQALAERLYRQQKLGDRTAVSFEATAERWLKADDSDKTTDRVVLEWLYNTAGIRHELISSVAHEAALEKIRDLLVAEGRKHSTVDRYMTTVSAVLNFGFGKKKGRREEGASVVSVPKFNARGTRPEPKFLTPEQYARLLPELPEHTQRFGRLGTLTLLRMRAMLSLTWAQVDLPRKMAWVAGAHQKNARTHRFPLSDAAVLLLKEIRAAQLAEYREYVDRCRHRYHREPEPAPEHVCTYRLKPIDDLNGAAFKAACRRAGVPWLTWHQFTRHTGASWGTQSGVSLEQRMQLGGWVDMRSAMVYSHLERSHVHSAAQAVGHMLDTALIVKSARRGKKRGVSST